MKISASSKIPFTNPPAAATWFFTATCSIRSQENVVWLAHVGDRGYQFLLKLNRADHAGRAWRGQEDWSLSKASKARFKPAVSHVGDFEAHIAELARARSCTGVMCGPIRTAADKMTGDLHSLNSGDRVEPLGAVRDHFGGRFELVHFTDFVREFPLDRADGGSDGRPLRPLSSPRAANSSRNVRRKKRSNLFVT